MTTSLAIVGSGAIGQFYGTQWVLAGYDVRFLARRDAATLAGRGLIVDQTAVPQIASSQRLTHVHLTPDRFRVDTRPEPLSKPSPPDWVFVTLKATALPDARPLIEPLVGPQTRIVVLTNGLGVEEPIAAWFGPERVFGLLCFVAVNRDDDGTIRHLGFGQVAAGHYLDRTEEREALVQLCRDAGVACVQCLSLLEARWRKLTWNVPFNGLCVLYDVTTDGIVQVPQRRAQAEAVANEVITIGNADLAAHEQAVRIELAWADEQLRRTDTMGAYAPSTLLDARAGRAIEHDVLFAEPLRRAEKLGVRAPTLRWLATSLAPPPNSTR